MISPISIPSKSNSAPNHSAREVTSERRNAPRGSSISPGRADARASHRGALDQYMSMSTCSVRLTYERHQLITRHFSRNIRARLIGATCSVHLSRRDTRKTNTRTFFTPNWPVTVPYMRRRACEGFTGGNNRNSCNQQYAHSWGDMLRIGCDLTNIWQNYQ